MKSRDEAAASGRKSRKSRRPAGEAAGETNRTIIPIPDDDPGNPQLGRPDAVPKSSEVEVQFRTGAVGIASALAANAMGFMEEAFAGGTTEAGLQVARVLRDHTLEHGEASFADPHLQAEDERLLNRANQGDLAPPDPLDGLPRLRSFVRLRFATPAEAEGAVRALRALPDVERAVVLPGAMPPSEPSDPMIGTPAQGVAIDENTGYQPQWYLHRTRVPEAWAMGARGANVVIADVDWGFLVSHQDLEPRLEMGHAWNAYHQNRTVTLGPKVRHGTAVLGLAGAAADGKGMAGYAPEADLWPIQGNGNGPPEKAKWHDAIEYVRREDSGGRRKVILVEVETEPSSGNYEQVPAVNEAIRRAIASKCVVCVAAGNGRLPADIADNGKDEIPATGSILVGATLWHSDPQVNPRAPWSNWGARIVVSAPGDFDYDVSCSHMGPGQYWNKFGGTSGAAAKVAGVAALMLSVNPHLSHDEVREILRVTGTSVLPFPDEPDRDAGVFLNAAGAVELARRRLKKEGQGATPAGAAVRIEGLARQSVGRHRGGGAADPADPAGQEAAPAPADRTLGEFRRSTEGLMTRDQRLLVIDQAIHLLELFYVHRPIKEAMHAVRPVQRLRVLRRRVEEDPDAWAGRRELRLHNQLTDVFLSVRDLHTAYLLPQPYRDYTAFLPFLVRPYCDPDGRRRYMVTRVVPGYSFADPRFVSGVDILFWNGIDIEAAVELSAQQTAGSNLAARHVRGVDALTLRPMNVALPPEADWVYITFRGEDGTTREMRQDWLVRFTPLDDPAAPQTAVLRRLLARGAAERAAAEDGGAPAASPARAVPAAIQDEAGFSLDAAGAAYSTTRELVFAPADVDASPAASRAEAREAADEVPDLRALEYQAAMGIDAAADAVREVKQLLFTPENVTTARERAWNGTLEGDAREGEGLPTHMPLVFYARRRMLEGRERAYLRIRTFAVYDPDAFVREFVRLLEQLPRDGLILDVRGNGGGHIFAAERLLQTLTPRTIEPERLQFISTTGTLDLCRRNGKPPVNLSSWTQSLEQAVLTGSTYSQALPITDPESCNAIGQRYYGPVVLLVDGRCYSATDIFAAGFQDHEIGPIVGTSPTTGAGGANVWGHDLLNLVYAGDGSPLRPLPHRMGMRVAIRQTLRVGARAGTLLEDFGVSPTPELVHRITRRDLRDEDADLLEFAARVLDQLPAYHMALEETGRTDERVHFRVRAEKLDRVDFYLDGRPASSVNLDREPPSFSVRSGTRVELRGFARKAGSLEGRWVASLKHAVR